MAHELISREDYNFIHKVIGPQLQKSEYADISINSKTCYINYCTIDNKDPISFIDVIVLVCGFGSGWTGSSLLGYELATLGYQMTMVSMLGYGNSDNPPMFTWSDFLEDAIYLNDWAKKIFPGKNIHWVGHSMGASIITELTLINPNIVASLTLLDPVGFQKRNFLELGLKFLANGIGHARKFSGNPKWKELKKFLPKEKSPFTFDRIRQRIRECNILCNDHSLKTLRKILKEKQVRCMYGEKDSLFTRTLDCDGLIYVPLPHLWHNTTMFGSDLTAKEIDNFIFNLIK
ncbi:MAG: alpha/beta hydrolase [Candidatus Moranbacteria bacterium]|nr:alpha/beta hydrolase [Candidatus Moranbacteria bacterium]